MTGFIFWLVISAAIAVWFTETVKANFVKAEQPMTASEGALHFLVPFVAPLVCFALSSTGAGMIAAIAFGVGMIVITVKLIRGFVPIKLAELATLTACGIAQSIKMTMLGNISPVTILYIVAMLLITITVILLSTDWEMSDDISDDDAKNIAVSMFCVAIAIIAIMVIIKML